jgi:hypothetical protein
MTAREADERGIDFTPRAGTQITINGICQGWPIAISFTGKLEQLPGYLERLSAAGVTPAVAAPAAPQRRQKPVEPYYQPDGTPCCPKHLKPLREGHYGLHCTAKDPEGKNGYCSLKFN